MICYSFGGVSVCFVVFVIVGGVISVRYWCRLVLCLIVCRISCVSFCFCGLISLVICVFVLSGVVKVVLIVFSFGSFSCSWMVGVLMVVGGV